jgi:major membrane immunogen (membrane-anchored lipoprotein)
MSHKLKRGRALSERADSKVERIDMATQHSQKEWRRLQDGLVAGEHGQDH